jgi:hypothetical protein
MFMYSGRDATQQHCVLKEVDTGTAPNRDAGNAISQRQGATGAFVAMRAAGPEAGTSVKLFAHDLKAYVFGDVNGDLAPLSIGKGGARAPEPRHRPPASPFGGRKRASTTP